MIVILFHTSYCPWTTGCYNSSMTKWNRSPLCIFSFPAHLTSWKKRSLAVEQSKRISLHVSTYVMLLIYTIVIKDYWFCHHDDEYSCFDISVGTAKPGSRLWSKTKEISSKRYVDGWVYFTIELVPCPSPLSFRPTKRGSYGWWK